MIVFYQFNYCYLIISNSKIYIKGNQQKKFEIQFLNEKDMHTTQTHIQCLVLIIQIPPALPVAFSLNLISIRYQRCFKKIVKFSKMRYFDLKNYSNQYNQFTVKFFIMNWNIQQRRLRRRVELYRSRVLRQLYVVKNAEKSIIAKNINIEIIQSKYLLDKLKKYYGQDAWKFHMKQTHRTCKYFGLIRLCKQDHIPLKLGDMVIAKRNFQQYDYKYQSEDSDSEDSQKELNDANEQIYEYRSENRNSTKIKSEIEIQQQKKNCIDENLLTIDQSQCQICQNFQPKYFQSLKERKKKTYSNDTYLSIIRYVDIQQKKSLIYLQNNKTPRIISWYEFATLNYGYRSNTNIVLIVKIGTNNLRNTDLSEGYNKQIDLLNIDIEIQRQIRAVKNMKSELNLRILKHLFFPQQFQYHQNKHHSKILLSLQWDISHCINHISQHTLSIIKTPPGTSHDDLINQICLHYLGQNNKNNYKILVTDPTNFSVNQSSVELYQNVTKKIVRIFSMDIFEFNEEDRISEIISEISEKTKILKMIIRQSKSFSKYFTKPNYQRKLLQCFRQVLGAPPADTIDELFQNKQYRQLLEIPLIIRLKFILSQKLAGNQNYSDKFEEIFNIYWFPMKNIDSIVQILDRFIDDYDFCYPTLQFILRQLLTEHQKVKLMTHKKIIQDMGQIQGKIYKYVFKKGLHKLLYYLVFIPRFQQWICRKIQSKSYEILQISQVNYGYDYMMSMLGKVISEEYIVTCTCMKAGYHIINEFDFDIIIINEAAQTNQLNALIAMTHRPLKVVILGDDSQLKIVNLKNNEQQMKLPQLNLSLFERLLYQDHPYKKLKFQTLMNPVIADFININFYEKQLLSQLRHKNQFQPKLFSQCLKTNRPIIIKDVYIKGKQLEEQVDSSYSNYQEVIQIKAIISKIRKFDKKLLKDVGIITPYKSQSFLLRQKLSKYRDNYELQINTIDGFHGKIRDYIIISMVRSNFNGDIGFMRQQQRINVCLTRARKGIYLVCDVQTVLKSKSKIWKKFIQQHYTD